MVWNTLIRVLFVLVACIFINSNNANSQEFDPSQIQNVNVDELSDDQIRRIISELETRGISLGEFEVLAKSRGASSLQIEKLKTRIREVRSGRSNDDSVSTPKSEDSRLRDEFVIDPVDLFLDEEDLMDVDESEKVFGMDLFQSENLTFQPRVNIPTPVNYQLGTGDELIVDIWGASEQTYQLSISPEGTVRIPNLGPIFISGLTVKVASEKIKSRLKRIYNGLGNNTYADISLGQAKSINVNIVGEVQKQGSYLVSSFSTIFNALYLAGGPNENGSLRNIDLFRNNKRIATLDVYDFLFNGVNINTTLQDGDLIIVRPYDKRVQIIEEVKRQGYYEIKEGETLSQLIQYAGGFTGTAYRKSINVTRNKELKKSIMTVSQDEYDDFSLDAGDEIIVSGILDLYLNRVHIENAVNKPGEYELVSGMKLSELIDKAEGVREDAFYNRGVILRLNEDLTKKVISFDLKKILNGESDYLLQNEDSVLIKSKFELSSNLTVQIQGEIRYPNEFPYIDSMTVEDLIYAAGGFELSALRSTVEVSRRKPYDDSSNPTTTAEVFNFSISEDLSLSSEASHFYLKPHDLVIVRKSPYYLEQTIVEVQGEVNLPGKYAIEKKDERISDLLKRSGGITNFGYLKGATLVRITEFFDEDGSEADKLRRENIEELSTDSVTTFAVDFKRSETIGINLEEILKNPGSKYDLFLKPGDILGIPKQLQTVRLRGELLYPSTVRYDKNRTFKDYISQAGGFSSSAKKSKSYILYANGTVERTKGFLWFKNYPKVEPGAEVIIPLKPDRRKLSPGEIISIASGLGTIALIVNNLTN